MLTIMPCPQVRQQGRAALQQALWERAEGRFRARTVGPMAANLSSILMSDLDVVQGKQVPYAAKGGSPLELHRDKGFRGRRALLLGYES